MNKNCKILIIMSFLIISLLAGCSNMPGDDDENSRTSFTPTIISNFEDQPLINKQLNSFLFVNGKPKIIQELSSGKANKVYVHLQSFDANKAVELLISNDTIEKRIESDGDYLGEKVKLFDYTTSSGKQLYNGLGKELHFRLSSSDPLYNVGYLCWDGSGIGYNLDKFSTTKELEFCSREEAAQNIKNILRSLNISFKEQYECYTLDHLSLQKEEQDLMNSGNESLVQEYSPVENWNQKYDSYAFFFQNSIDGIPVSKRGYGDAQGGNLIYNNKIRVIYNQSGVIELSINNVYEKRKTEIEGEKIIIAEEALEKLAESYNKLISITPLIIQQINLEYIPTLYSTSRTEFLMIPAWRIWVQNQSESSIPPEKDNSAQERIVDAISGHLIQ